MPYQERIHRPNLPTVVFPARLMLLKELNQTLRMEILCRRLPGKCRLNLLIPVVLLEPVADRNRET